MSSAQPSVSTEKERPNPGVDAGKTTFHEADTALRLAIGHFTVDVVHDRGGDGLLTMIGEGVGTEPQLVDVDEGTVAVLVAMADCHDVRTVWETQAWPMAA